MRRCLILLVVLALVLTGGLTVFGQKPVGRGVRKSGGQRPVDVPKYASPGPAAIARARIAASEELFRYKGLTITHFPDFASVPRHVVERLARAIERADDVPAARVEHLTGTSGLEGDPITGWSATITGVRPLPGAYDVTVEVWPLFASGASVPAHTTESYLIDSTSVRCINVQSVPAPRIAIFQ